MRYGTSEEGAVTADWWHHQGTLAGGVVFEAAHEKGTGVEEEGLPQKCGTYTKAQSKRGGGD